jgi:Sulfatase
VIRRIATAAAFATWCFLNTWVELAEGQSAYFARYDPFRTVVLPVICWELVLTAGIFAVWEFCRRRLGGSRTPHILFLAVCFVPFGTAALAFLRVLPFNLIPLIRRPGFRPAVLLCAGVVAIFALWHPERFSRPARSLFLYSWPVLAVIVGQAARATLLKYPHASYADRALLPTLKAPPGRARMVWIIFDELSQTIVFKNRPAGLELPNFDRLRTDSFCASEAKAPGASTEISMPSLILGKPVAEVLPRGPEHLYLRLAGSRNFVDWSTLPNLFDSARQLGWNSAIVGWFHPYGRLLNRSLTKCYWTAGWLNSGVEEPAQPQSLETAMGKRALLQLTTLPLVGHLPGVFPGIYQRREKTERFSYLLDRALEIVGDPSIGLSLIHLPVPHPPAIYDRRQRKITADGRIGYVDSVALADWTLGLLRRRMEQAGLWNQTAVLVSADHGWRTYLWRGDPEWTVDEEAASHQDTLDVPFLLKLPGQNSGVEYDGTLPTIVTRRLIVDILRGDLTDPRTIPGHLGVRPGRADP